MGRSNHIFSAKSFSSSWAFKLISKAHEKNSILPDSFVGRWVNSSASLEGLAFCIWLMDLDGSFRSMVLQTILEVG